MSLRAESTALRTGGDGEWASLPPTEMFRGHVRDLADAIALDIDAGVRRR